MDNRTKILLASARTYALLARSLSKSNLDSSRVYLQRARSCISLIHTDITVIRLAA